MMSKMLNNNLEVIVLVIVVLIVLFPFAYSVIGSAFTPDNQNSQPFIEKPDEKYKECVRDTEYMRIHHMDLLNQIRDEVVREGKKAEIGLDNCWECHTSKERFCDRCHNIVNLQVGCFNCHHYPK
ncbi:MAG: sulfate reduction electron transfer complex DsrMKJOP subunit DsrJ [Planctomycetota bacterium]|jgi:7-cyano-7-deazaguanine synthase in queuosine biosynthesis